MTRGEQAGATRSEREPMKGWNLAQVVISIFGAALNLWIFAETPNPLFALIAVLLIGRAFIYAIKLSPRLQDAGTELDRSAKTEAKHSDGGSSPR